MNARWLKEIRPLLWPWCIAGLAMVILLPGAEQAQGIGYCVLLCSVAVMAALPFGIEFQHGTWALVLGQPVQRARIWREKLQTVCLPLVTLWLLYWRLATFVEEPSLLQVALGMNLVLGAICMMLICLEKPSPGLARLWLCVASLPMIYAAVSCLAMSSFGVNGWGWNNGLGSELSGGLLDKIAVVCWAGMAYAAAFFYLGWRYWRRKQLLAWSALIALVVAAGLSQDELARVSSEQLSIRQLIQTAACLLPTVCAACFWTLIARSTVGGVVFNLASQFVVVAVAMSTLESRYGNSLTWDNSNVLLPLLAVGALFSVSFLWLGKRRLDRLQWKQSVPSEESASTRLSARWLGWFTLLHCRREGALRNLVRKEARLQAPAFTVAVLFCFCWFAALILLPREGALTRTDMLGVLIATYVPLAAILTGAVPLGEEKTLGVTSWQLSLPMGWLRQWWVKVGVSATVCIILALALPGALVALTANQAGIEPGQWQHNLRVTNPAAALGVLCGVTFTLSFWAASLLRDTIKTVLTTIAVLFLLSACAALGAWVGTEVVGMGLARLLIHSLDLAVVPGDDMPGFALHLAVSVPVVIAAALVQSALQFRREHVGKGTLWKCTAILAVVVFVAAY